MSLIQKLWLAFLGALALIAVSVSIGYMYLTFRVSQQLPETDCAFAESSQCLQYGKITQPQVVQTHSTESNSSLNIIPSTPQPVSINFTITPTIIISTVPLTPFSVLQTNTPTTEKLISDTTTVYLAEDWRDFPIVPEFSLNAQKILSNVVANGYLGTHTFVKVGDCHMESGIFLSGYVKGSYRTPVGLDNTVEWFSQSMVTDNITAVTGYGINTVLDPAYALAKGHEYCFIDETPLDCELRTKHPSVVLIAMGTNWIPHGEESFEKHLRAVVSRVLETGALPILATKADNLEGDWKINRAIAQVSIDYDIPLVNIWRAMQDIPNNGLRPDGFHLTGDGWLRNSSTWLKTLESVYHIVSQ